MSYTNINSMKYLFNKKFQDKIKNKTQLFCGYTKYTLAKSDAKCYK